VNLTKQALRACLVRDTGFALKELTLLLYGDDGLFLQGSFLSFRSVSTKERYQIAPPRTPEPTKRFNPHPYQTRSNSGLRK
jgi:hypothetical protein